MSQRLGLDLAAAMVDASIGKAEDLGVAMTVAVCDSGGHPIVVMRMDGAMLVSVDTAPAKARTAVYFQRPTGMTVARSRVHPTVYTSFMISSPVPLVLSVGGYPLWDGDDLAGAIASAGGTGAQDAVVSTQGLLVWEEHVGRASGS
jgi:glc operon protein GlcG